MDMRSTPSYTSPDLGGGQETKPSQSEATSVLNQFDAAFVSLSLPKIDGAAKSRRGMRSDVFNPLCISPNLGGEGEGLYVDLRTYSNARSM